MSQAEHNELELKRERARRAAREAVDADLATAVPRRLGRRKVRDVVAQALAELQVRHEYGVNGFKTGISSLDSHVQRVMQGGRVICVAADTKGGKTAFVGQLVVALAAQGLPTLLGSFEDEQQDTVYRWLANLSSGDVGVIRDGFTRPDGSKLPIPAGFDQAVDKLAGLGIEVIARTGTIEQIAFEAMHWWHEQRSGGAQFGVLVLDQLSHIIPSDRETFRRQFPGYPEPPHRDNLVAMLQWQVQMMQRIAKKLNLLVIFCHQLNTQHKEWEKPTQRSLRSSQGIAHEVDALFIPWRPSKLRNPARGIGEPEWVPNAEDRAWIVCPIGRQVQKFDLEVDWHGGQQRFADKGSHRRMPWVAPEAPGEKSIEGLGKLAALRSAWAAETEDVTAAANGAQRGARPALPPPLPKLSTSPDAQWPEEVRPALVEPVGTMPTERKPSTGTGFGVAGTAGSWASTDPF